MGVRKRIGRFFKGEAEMRFSVDSEAVNDVLAMLTQYSEELDLAFCNFQEKIKSVVVRTNYHKLLVALQSIVQRYNDIVCGSMREQMINAWIEEGESLLAFAEDLFMGKESEAAARRIETHLGEIFGSFVDNNLLNLEFAGDSNAAREDFDEVSACFVAFQENAAMIVESHKTAFIHKVDENELFRFLMPLVEAIGVGVVTFTAAAKQDIDTLGENYEEKLKAVKEKVGETRHKGEEIAFDLELFDVDDGSAVSPGVVRSINGVVQRPPKRNNSQYAALIQALEEFNCLECQYKQLYIDAERKHLNDFQLMLEKKVQAYKEKLEGDIKGYHAQLAQKVNKKYKSLKYRCQWKLLTPQRANVLYQQYCMETEQLFNAKKQACREAYKQLRDEQRRAFLAECRRCEDIRKNRLCTESLLCDQLFQNKANYIAGLKSPIDAERTAKEIQNIVDNVYKRCSRTCRLFRKLDPLSDPLNAHLKKFERLKEQMSWRDHLKATNPKFLSSVKKNDMKYTHNCQRCVMAYEVRRRGFDVTAKPLLKIDDELAKMDASQGWPSVFQDKNGNKPVPESVGGDNTLEAIRNIEKKMKSYGDGARAIVRIQRVADFDGSALSGHVFIAEQINGKTIFCDPQTGSENALKNFGYYNNKIGDCSPLIIWRCSPLCKKDEASKITLEVCRACTDPEAKKNTYVCTEVKVSPNYMKLLRIDNLMMTDQVLKCCLSEKKNDGSY